MLNFQQKKKLRDTLYSKGMLIGLALLVLFLGNATWSVYKKYSEAKENRERGERELNELELRKQTLTDEIKRLESERGIEEELRKRFGVVKEGEEVLIVVPPQSFGNDTTGEAQQSEGIWQKFLNFFR